MKESHLEEKKQRVRPSVGKIQHYQHNDTILGRLERETGKDFASPRREKGDLRRLAMELLYRYGGLTGPEIGALFGIDYNAVSQERRRLHERVTQDEKLHESLERVKDSVSTMKI